MGLMWIWIPGSCCSDTEDKKLWLAFISMDLDWVLASLMQWLVGERCPELSRQRLDNLYWRSIIEPDLPINQKGKPPFLNTFSRENKENFHRDADRMEIQNYYGRRT